MHNPNQNNVLTSLARGHLGIAPLIALLLFFAAGGLLAQTVEINSKVMPQGNPYVPTGANFQIVALQGIDSSHAFGDSNFSPSVNVNFEFDPSIGVSFDQGNSKLKDFGLGLYQDKQHNTFSTGLDVQYNQPVLASSVTITVMDFDLKANDPFFKNEKVQPSIILLGPGNTIYGTASPADIFPNLVAVPPSGNGKDADIWTLNFAALLNTLHLADAPITGFILSADSSHGEKTNSDPYLLLSVGNGTQVPEPSTYMLVIVACAFSGLFHGGRAYLKNRARE